MNKLDNAELRQNQNLKAHLQTLEAENKRLRVELDWMRDKLLEAETTLWWGQPATTIGAQQGTSVG